MTGLTNGIRAMFFDLDGCIYFGRTLADRANDLLDLLRAQGYRIGFITNNSRENAQEIRSRLKEMGLRLEEELIVSATEAVAGYLRDAFGRVSVKAAGSVSLITALADAGHRVLDWADSGPADVIVLGRDTAFDYCKLELIVNEISLGARLIGTNPDCAHPGEEGRLVPETGSLLAAVESITGGPIISIGKPHAWLYELAMSRYGVAPTECMMIGDNLATDVTGAVRTGMKTVWIRNSPLSAAVDRSVVPTLTVGKLADFYELLTAEAACE